MYISAFPIKPLTVKHHTCSCLLRKLSSIDSMPVSYHTPFELLFVHTGVTKKLTSGNDKLSSSVERGGTRTSVFRMSQLHVNKDKVRSPTSRQILIIALV